MRRIDASTLRPGMRLPLGLYTRQGVKLLSSGRLLTEDMCRMISQSSWGDLYLASSAEDLQLGEILMPAEPIHTGETAIADIITAGGILAVEAGQTVETHHEDAYELGAFLGTPDREDTRLRAARMKIADQYVADLRDEWSRLPSRIQATPIHFAAEPVHRAPAAWPDETHLALVRNERIRRFRRIFARILSGLPVQVAEPASLITELIHWQRANPERFAQLALLGPHTGDYLPEHGYAVACLSVAIAARLGWSNQHIRLAGLAGLLSDVGMAFVPAELRASGRPLNEIELNRVRRHPTYSVIMLEAVEGLPEEVRRAAYQHHERENGTGYPNGLRTRQLSDLSRLVAVADAFAAAATRRRYRAAKRPYDAMEEVIMQASTGVYDRRAVRALVETAGLFPVGSHVLLSNDAAAIVVGTQPSEIDRPIVRILHNSGTSTRLGITIRLADFERNELWIRQPIDPPADRLSADVA